MKWWRRLGAAFGLAVILVTLLVTTVFACSPKLEASANCFSQSAYAGYDGDGYNNRKITWDLWLNGSHYQDFQVTKNSFVIFNYKHSGAEDLDVTGWIKMYKKVGVWWVEEKKEDINFHFDASTCYDKASASVTLGTCAPDGIGQSHTPATISLVGANLTINGQTYNTNTNINLNPGSYPWTSAALPGYQFEGSAPSGTLTVEDCGYKPTLSVIVTCEKVTVAGQGSGTLRIVLSNGQAVEKKVDSDFLVTVKWQPPLVNTSPMHFWAEAQLFKGGKVVASADDERKLACGEVSAPWDTVQLFLQGEQPYDDSVTVGGCDFQQSP